MEGGNYCVSSQDRHAAGACGLPTDLCHVCLEQSAQARYSPKVYIPSASRATRPVELQWSICVPPDWIYDYSCCRSATICHRTAFVQPVRGGHSLRHVYKVVILSKLLYASPAWWGFTSAADKQRLEASLRRAVRSGLYSVDDPSFSQLVEDMDDNLFAKIQFNPHHFLYKLLPEKTDRTYNLRPRSHSFTLSVKTDSRNYINRMLFKDIS